MAEGFAIFISVVACGISFFAWRDSKQAVRASIYDRRFEVYSDAEEFIGYWMQDGTPDLSKLHVLKGAWVRSQFLFGQNVTDYLRKVWLDAIEADKAQGIKLGRIEGEYEEALETNHKLLMEHADFEKLRKIFISELRVDL